MPAGAQQGRTTQKTERDKRMYAQRTRRPKGQEKSKNGGPDFVAGPLRVDEHDESKERRQNEPQTHVAYDMQATTAHTDTCCHNVHAISAHTEWGQSIKEKPVGVRGRG